MQIQLIPQSIIYGSSLVQQLSNCIKHLIQAECHHLFTVNLGLIENAENLSEQKRVFITKQEEQAGLDVDWLRFKDGAARSRKTCKKAHNNFISSSVASSNKSDSKFFRFIKSKRNENVGISPLRENSTMLEL